MPNAKQWLTAIFLLTLSLRLFLALTIPNFTYESYFHLRQTESIQKTGLPIFEDELSYGGRSLRFLPLFHYLIAGFALFLPLELVAKMVPNILIAALTILIYLISYKITNDKTASLLSAFIAGFLPILYFTNSFSTETLFLPLIFLAIYSFLNLEQKKFLYIYIASILFLSLTSSATVLLLFGFLLYLLLSFLENKPLQRQELEVMFFSLVFFIWVQFLFFKEVLISEGIGFIWQNIPQQILEQYFPSFSVIDAIILVSVIPFLIGILVVYQSLFKSKNEPAFLLISLVLSTSIMGWLRLIQFKFSLAFFGIVLSILFSIFYRDLHLFVSRTKLSQLKQYLPALVILLLSLSLIFPAVTVALRRQETPSASDLAAFQWLGQQTAPDAKIAALLEEGHLITYYAQRRNVMDDKFNLIDDVNERLVNLNGIFTTSLHTYALDVFDQYDITHIMFTEQAKTKLANSNFQYLTVDCYERIYDEKVKIYRIKCMLTEDDEANQ